MLTKPKIRPEINLIILLKHRTVHNCFNFQSYLSYMTLYLVFCFNQKHLCLIIVIKQMNANWKMDTFLHVSRDLNLRAAYQLDNRPSYEEVHNSMRTARMLANGLSPILTVIFVLIWPSLLLLEGVFDLASFKRWVSILNIFILFIFNDNKPCKCFISQKQEAYRPWQSHECNSS